jgi:hypothetical protein
MVGAAARATRRQRALATRTPELTVVGMLDLVRVELCAVRGIVQREDQQQQICSGNLAPKDALPAFRTG